MMIVNTDVFRAAAEAIANMRPCPIEGRVTSDQVKVAIGELLDVWPASIFDAVAGDEASLSIRNPENAHPDR